MPRVGVPRLSSMTPQREGIICAYPSWSVLIVKPNHLPGKPEGGPFTRDIVEVSVGIRLIWRW
jgi:hypothetical protein